MSDLLEVRGLLEDTVYYGNYVRSYVIMAYFYSLLKIIDRIRLT